MEKKKFSLNFVVNTEVQSLNMSLYKQLIRVAQFVSDPHRANSTPLKNPPLCPPVTLICIIDSLFDSILRQTFQRVHFVLILLYFFV